MACAACCIPRLDGQKREEAKLEASNSNRIIGGIKSGDGKKRIIGYLQVAEGLQHLTPFSRLCGVE